MGQVTIGRDEAIEILLEYDDDLDMSLVCMYADAFVEYQEAQENIDRNGAIVLHPRTGAPMPNPYSDVKARAMKSMLALKLDEAPSWLWGEFDKRRKNATDNVGEAPHAP